MRCTLSPPSAPVGSARPFGAIAVKEAVEHRVAVLGGGRFRMKLHADDRMRAMLHAP